MSTISIRDGETFISSQQDVQAIVSGTETITITLSNISDTDIQTPVNGQVLVYNNGDWENQSISTTITEVDGGSY